jgi:hypothetical protein
LLERKHVKVLRKATIAGVALSAFALTGAFQSANAATTARTTAEPGTHMTAILVTLPDTHMTAIPAKSPGTHMTVIPVRLPGTHMTAIPVEYPGTHMTLVPANGAITV